MSPVEHLHFALNALPETKQVRSRFGPVGRAAWAVRGREFAHLHADDMVDLRLSRAIQSQLKSNPLAHFRSSRSEWLEFEFRSLTDVQDVLVFARQAWAAAKEAK